MRKRVPEERKGPAKQQPAAKRKPKSPKAQRPSRARSTSEQWWELFYAGIDYHVGKICSLIEHNLLKICVVIMFVSTLAWVAFQLKPRFLKWVNYQIDSAVEASVAGPAVAVAPAAPAASPQTPLLKPPPPAKTPVGARSTRRGRKTSRQCSCKAGSR
jgi:hypothetical protein